jgi:hypothetical protein
MTKELAELFKDKEYCYRELAEARKLWGNKDTTEAQFDQLETTLTLMLVHCPSDIQYAVQASIREAGMRRTYFEMLWIQNRNKRQDDDPHIAALAQVGCEEVYQEGRV